MTKKVVKQILKLGGLEVSRYKKSNDWYASLFKKYALYTMIPESLFKLNLELCDQHQELDGDYVECGVWKGGISAAIAEVLGKNRHIHLFDSFQGLPPAQAIDGKEALDWQRNTLSSNYHDNCKAEKSFALQAIALANHQNYHLYEGWFQQTLASYPGNPIGILRLDGDWYDSIIICLRSLFPYVITDGIVILDDYYTWDGCAKAVHDYLSEIKSPSTIHQWNNQVAFIRKKNE